MAIDPYRTLELAPGATTAEIKRAYRRLAKANHPDSAGAAATPRFLAIQAAYEMLIGEKIVGGPGRPRPRRTAPWQADPDRARATREAWRARTGRQRGSSAEGTAPGEASTGTPRTGGSTPRGRPVDGASAGSRAKRSHRKASLGSTSYDDALEQPLDPDWTGASWYGRSSGTYWTLNPKEYADPRKHGPEYQARARRAFGMGAADATSGEASERESRVRGEPDRDDVPLPERDEAPMAARDEAPAAGPHGREWPAASMGPQAPGAATSMPPAHPRARPGEASARWTQPRGWPDQAGDAPSLDPEALLLTVFAGIVSPNPRPRARLVRAALGWVPLAWAIATLAGELTGCARLAASCTAQAVGFSLVAVVAPLPILVAAPRAAGIAAAGALALLLLALPLGALVVLFLGSFDPAGRDVLAVLLTAAFVSGVVGGLFVDRDPNGQLDPAVTLWPVALPAVVVLLLTTVMAMAGVQGGGIRLATSTAALVVFIGTVAVATATARNAGAAEEPRLP